MKQPRSREARPARVVLGISILLLLAGCNRATSAPVPAPAQQAAEPPAAEKPSEAPAKVIKGAARLVSPQKIEL